MRHSHWEVAGTAPHRFWRLPDRWFERAALVFLVSAGLLGVFLRTKYVYSGFLSGLTFGNLLHGHSHTMFFGWVALALSGLIYRELGRLGGPDADRLWGWRLIAVQWWGTVAATTVAMFSFSMSGYSPLSIAMATVNMLLWYVAAAVVWRNTPGDRPVWVGFYRAAAFYLALSTLGTWTLTVLEVTGRAGTPFLSTAPVYFYLSNYIDGWAVLGVTGLIYQLLAPHLAGRGYSLRLAELQLKWQTVLTLPAYLHYLAGFAAVPAWVHLLGAVFTVALLVPAGLFVYNLRGLFRRGSLRPGASGLTLSVLALLRWAVAYAAAKAVAEAVSVLPGIAPLIYGPEGRQWVVVGLHTTLFGLVTFGLLAGVLAGGRGRGESPPASAPRAVPGVPWATAAVQGSGASLALMLAFLTLAALGVLVPALAARYALWFQGAWVASLLLWVFLTALAAAGWRRRSV